MFDSQKELLQEIAFGECALLEFKEVRFRGNKVSVPDPDELADGLAAFANSRGGVFVLGVEDETQEVVGIPLERLDGVVQYAREVLFESIHPPIEDAVVDRLTLPTSTGDELAIVKVEVPRSLFVHRSPGGYLHRVADSKRPMSSEYLARLFQQRSQTRLIRFDEQPVASARLEDLAPDLTDRLRTPRSDEDGVTFLRKLGIAVQDEDKVIRPTVAGVLMGTANPCRWLRARTSRRSRIGAMRYDRIPGALPINSTPKMWSGRWTARSPRPAASSLGTCAPRRRRTKVAETDRNTT